MEGWIFRGLHVRMRVSFYGWMDGFIYFCMNAWMLDGSLPVCLYVCMYLWIHIHAYIHINIDTYGYAWTDGFIGVWAAEMFGWALSRWTDGTAEWLSDWPLLIVCSCGFLMRVRSRGINVLLWTTSRCPRCIPSCGLHTDWFHTQQKDIYGLLGRLDMNYNAGQYMTNNYQCMHTTEYLTGANCFPNI